MKERYTVEICGTELNLLSEEQEDYVLRLAKILDGRIRGLVMSSKRASKTEAAILCALGFLDDKLKASLELESVAAERDEALRENERLKKELDELRQHRQSK